MDPTTREAGLSVLQEGAKPLTLAMYWVARGAKPDER